MNTFIFAKICFVCYNIKNIFLKIFMEKKEKINESQEKNNHKKVDIKNLFLKEFWKFVLFSKDKNKILEEIVNKKSIDESEILKKSLEKFKKANINENIKNFDLSKLNISELKRELAKEFVSLDNVREIYFDYILKNYDLEDKDIKKIQSSDEFKLLNNYQIENLLKNESENVNFLSKILNKKIKTKNEITFFKNLKDKEIEQRLNEVGKKSPDLLKNLKIALLNISEWKANSEDFKFLFWSNFLKDEEKKEILEKFIPYLSLWEARDYWLLSKEELGEFKKKFIEKYLENLEWSDKDLKSKLFEFLSEYDIKAPSYVFLQNSWDLTKLIENYDFSGIANTLKKEFNKHWEDKENNVEILKDFWIDIKKLKKENVIEIIIPEKTEDGKTTDFNESYFFEIKDIDNKWLVLKDIWKNEDIHYNWETKKLSFKQLVESLHKKSWKIKLYTKKEFKEIISDENSKFDIDSSFEFKYNFNDEVEKEKAKKEILDYLNNEKKKIKQELEDLEAWVGEYAWLDKDKKIEKQKELEKKLENIDLEIVDVKEDKIWEEELLWEYNFVKFLEELDYLDKKGKNIGFWKWVFIEKWKWLFDSKDEWGWAYEVVDILKDEWKIKLKSLAWVELVDFETFLKVFKKDKFKRIKKVENFEEILNNKLTDTNWKNVKLDNWKLIQKDVEYNWEKKDREIKFLIWNKTDKIVKINEINQDRVKVEFWRIKDLNEKEKKSKKYNVKDDIHEIELWDEVEISLTELNKYIEDFELFPDWKIWHQKLKKESPRDIQNKIKWSFSTRLFNKYSISELVAWAKLMVSGIEEYLKKWNDIHAAKFALWLWQILPEEIRADLKIKVEREEAEAMDKAIDGLSKVDSPIATARIKKWLLNKDTPEYKKEAWLMFMLQKYGVLYAKELTEYQWKFLWYEAFGWRVWDELYNSVKEESERNNVPFSEEKLMHMLLKKQCKWLLKPERRSRLHKDYEWKWKTWVKEEFEKWYDDASKKRNAGEMVKGWMDEAFWGTIPNAIWWFKKAVERWDTPEVMSEWFFSLMYSWVLWEQDENLLVKLKDLWDWDGLPIIMIRFASNKWDIDFFNRTVLELSKRIQEVNKDKFPNIYNEAKEIFDEVLAWKWTEKERLKKTQNFWKKYSEPLTRALFFQDIWKSDTSKTDKIILLEKDKNPIFKKYYDTVRVFTWISWAFNKDLMDDESGEHWLWGLNHNEIIKRFFRMDSWRSIPSRNISVVERLWKKISEDINSVKDKNMEIKWWDNIENKRKYLKLILRDIFAWFITNHPDRLFLKKYVEASPFKDDMKKWWVNEEIISKFLNYSSWEILGWARWSDEIIDHIIDNILSWEEKHLVEKNPIFNTIDEIKEEVEDSIK